ncbi:MAG: hypothetical protein KIT84_24465 [Labilithrix sp.]|nr:hypothetical protein [Labilithrix sp.]MCW5814203.1 hypothetical protein [Labilithrix sp.]
MKRTRLFFLLSVLTGCAGLIGVPDLSFEEPEPDADAGADGNTADGNVVVDATPVTDSTVPDVSEPPDDAGTDADAALEIDSATCDLSKVATDKNNCGVCGNVCLGPSQCTMGTCDAIPIASVPAASFRYVVEHGDWLFAASSYPSTEYGIWRISKTSGNPVQIVSFQYTQAPVIVGDRLYFLVYDYVYDDAGRNGGLWYCDLADAETADTCTPHLVEIADNPLAIAAHDGVLYYADYNSRLHKWVPDGGPDAGGAPIDLNVVNGPDFIHVDANDTFYSATAVGRTILGKINALGTQGTAIAEYSTFARLGGPGNVTTTGSSVIAAFFDDGIAGEQGGELRRMTRTGTTECSYGAGTDGGVYRPHGIYLEGSRLYWTNLGDPYFPYFGGSIAMCPVDGCCTDPKILWRGVGAPSGITADATYVYWVNWNNGEVWKVQKP